MCFRMVHKLALVLDACKLSVYTCELLLNSLVIQ